MVTQPPPEHAEEMTAEDAALEPVEGVDEVGPDETPPEETEDERYVRDLGPHVHYAGPEHERHITKADFEMVGVKGQDTVIWDRGNGKRVALEDLSEDARQVIAREANFRFVE